MNSTPLIHRALGLASVCLLLVVGGAFAAVTTWTGNGGDQKWSNVLNWDNGVPGAADQALLDSGTGNVITLIDSSVSAICSKGSVNDTHAKPISLEITGGSFVVQDKALQVGNGTNTFGIIRMSGGSINIQGTSAGNGKLNIGNSGQGVLNINGGTITVKDSLNVPLDATGVGLLNLHGGTITCGAFAMRPTAGGLGTMDITRGTLIVTGNVATVINTYVANGWITAYSGNGTVNVDYNVSNPGSTTVTAVSDDVADGGGDQFLTLTNGNVKISYNLSKGWADYYWSNAKMVSHAYAAVRLPAYVTSKNYTTRTYSTTGAETVVTCSGGGNPAMKQHFLVTGADYFLVQVEMQGTNLVSNWMTPLQVAAPAAINLGITGDNRALSVPPDNSNQARYGAWPMNSTDTGYHVTALYDNTSRAGLILGAVTHATWKTGVDFSGSHNKIDFLRVYGGAVLAQDVMPHGNVTGNNIFSPKVFVGYYPDWRTGMCAYADANLAIVPKLAKPPGGNAGITLGWKSSGLDYAINSNIDFDLACQVSDYFADYLQTNHFYNDQGTVTIRLDAGGEGNFSKKELSNWVAYCHANGQKAGSYFTPFKVGGAPTKDLSKIAVGSYTWREVILKDGSGNPITDSDKYALDPTHPGTQQLIADQFSAWRSAGMDYFRMDFIIEGKLEGVHYDPSKTGTQAYNEGMQYVLDQSQGLMQMNEGVSPTFPYQYAHSKRICNDVHVTIQDTEYSLESTAYCGWWLSRLYSSMDGGSVGYDPAAYDANEAKSRTIAAAINGGLIVDENNVTDPAQQPLVQSNLTRAGLMDLARLGKCFQAVEHNTGSYAPDAYVLTNAGVFYLAIFNFYPSSVAKSVDLTRAGLNGSTTYTVTDLWTGGTFKTNGTLSATLNGKEARLYKLEPPAPPVLQIARTNGNVALTINGDTGLPYTLQATTSFLAWTNLLVTNPPAMPVTWTDTNAPGGLQRFYRVLLGP